MCDPLTIAMTALGAAQSITSYQAAQDGYDAQLKAYGQNAENAARAAATNYSATGIKAQQEGEATAQQRQQTEIDAAQAGASAQVAAAAGGVSGLSVDAVLRDVYSQAARADTAADTNLRMSRAYLDSQNKATNDQARSQIASMPIPEKPSAFPYLLSGFSSALGAYTTKLQLEKK